MTPASTPVHSLSLIPHSQLEEIRDPPSNYSDSTTALGCHSRLVCIWTHNTDATLDLSNHISLSTQYNDPYDGSSTLSHSFHAAFWVLIQNQMPVEHISISAKLCRQTPFQHNSTLHRIVTFWQKINRVSIRPIWTPLDVEHIFYERDRVCCYLEFNHTPS